MELLIAIFFILWLISFRKSLIGSFKISYYETKLENRGVDIDHIKHIGLIEISKL